MHLGSPQTQVGSLPAASHLASRDLGAGPGDARSHAPASERGRHEASREAFLRSPVFSLAVLSPARPQPSPQAQGSQNEDGAHFFL